jgi:hypothetical protein
LICSNRYANRRTSPNLREIFNTSLRRALNTAQIC